MRGLRMADHVIDANWVKTSNVDLGESGFQQSRSRGPRRAAHAAAPGCHRPEMTAATALPGLPGPAGSASYDCA